ncbi:MAG: GNAT family N-acetyltransferase [Alphaproteobacteria bacterium]|nr:GNAT family N-acetyltransferase [Alphaproteobacteria bacterium]
MVEHQEYFGNAAQIDLAKRGNKLWMLLCNDPKYSFYGRMVSLCGPGDDAVARCAALANLQGAMSCQYYPANQADAFCAELESLHLNSSRYEQCRGEATAIEICRQTASNAALPDSVTLTEISNGSSVGQIRSVAELSLSCGVMPVPGWAMRGESRDGVCLVLEDEAGDAVATASSYMCNHPESPRGKDAFWGMLATREDWRGRGVAQVLGAEAIVRMADRYGAESFNTGVTADNAASLALCAKLGVTPSKWTFIGCVDPSTFGHGQITR